MIRIGNTRRRTAPFALLALVVAACGGADADGAAVEAEGAAARAALGSVAPPPLPQDHGLGLDLGGVGYDRGDPDATVQIVEFSDFGCPYCGVFARETYPELHERYVETGKVAWKYVPYVLGIFPNGAQAARAGECAGEQGESEFWAMHDRLYERQREWKSTGEPRELFLGYATELGLDAERFASCYDEDRRARRIRLGGIAGRQLGVRATPSFFVNGMRVQGAIPAEQFKMLLDMLLDEE